MAKAKGSIETSDRAKWSKIFNTLVHTLQNQQIQLQSLAKERKLLEMRIRLQHDRRVSDFNIFQGQISQMKRDLSKKEMERMVEATKADFMTGLKIREAFLYKHKFQTVNDEFTDIWQWFEYLSQKCSEGKGASSDVNSEISALLAEKNFIWNQYKQGESSFNEQLNRKHADLESANEKIQILLSDLEKLQASNSLKDNMIATLTGEIATLKSDSIKKDEDVSRLCREMEALKKSRNNNIAPVLQHCSLHSANNQSKGKSSKKFTVKEELGSSNGLAKGCKSSKRKEVETTDISDTPRLFTSSFKVPKLKSPSPVVH